MTIVAQLEQRRRRAELSPEALAYVAGVHAYTIRYWSRCARTGRPQSPTLATLEPVAEALGVRLVLEPIAPGPLEYVPWRGRRAMLINVGG